MNIKQLINGNIALAPMAGYTDVGFRVLCLRYGASFAVTEMVSAKALTYNNHVTFDLLKTSYEEKVRCVQLFGHEPDVMEQAAKMPQLADFDVIDINMGCPVPKIFNNGDGCALMQDMKLASEIIKAVKKSGKFVTVKFRAGVNSSSLIAPDFAKMCEDSGADAITIHGRTREQYYSGRADREIIGKAARSVSIPVFGNGDVRSKEDLEEYLSLGCFGVAVGRAAEGNPAIFAELSGNRVEVDVYRDICFHIEQLSYLPERVIVNEMKKHVAAYLKGRRGHKPVIVQVCRAQSIDEIKDSVREFLLNDNE